MLSPNTILQTTKRFSLSSHFVFICLGLIEFASSKKQKSMEHRADHVLLGESCFAWLLPEQDCTYDGLIQSSYYSYHSYAPSHHQRIKPRAILQSFIYSFTNGQTTTTTTMRSLYYCLSPSILLFYYRDNASTSTSD